MKFLVTDLPRDMKFYVPIHHIFLVEHDDRTFELALPEAASALINLYNEDDSDNYVIFFKDNSGKITLSKQDFSSKIFYPFHSLFLNSMETTSDQFSFHWVDFKTRDEMLETKEKLEKLNALLEKAVKKEDYEFAAKIIKKISKFKTIFSKDNS